MSGYILNAEQMKRFEICHKEKVLDELCKACQFYDGGWEEFCESCVVESARTKPRQVTR
jgi:hypothetical protein